MNRIRCVNERPSWSSGTDGERTCHRFMVMPGTSEEDCCVLLQLWRSVDHQLGPAQPGAEAVEVEHEDPAIGHVTPVVANELGAPFRKLFLGAALESPGSSATTFWEVESRILPVTARRVVSWGRRRRLRLVIPSVGSYNPDAYQVRMRGTMCSI